jgi:hypothetical protein
MPLSRTVAPYSSANRRPPAADPWAQAASTAFHTSYQPAGAGQPRDRLAHRRGRGVPNDQALLRLAGSLLIEQNDEWLVSRRYLSEASMAGLTTTEPTSTGKELQVA